MQLDNVLCTATTNEWAQQLQKAYPIAKDQSRLYVYMNPEGKLKVFASDDSARNKNYPHKLTAEKMIELTETFFREPGDPEKIYSARELYVLKHAFEHITVEVSGSRWYYSALSPTVTKAKNLSTLIRTGIEKRIDNERRELNKNYTNKFNELQRMLIQSFDCIPPFMDSFKKSWGKEFSTKPKNTEANWEAYITELESQIELIGQRKETIELITKTRENLYKWNIWFQRKDEFYPPLKEEEIIDIEFSEYVNGTVEYVIENENEKAPLMDPNTKLNEIITNIFSNFGFHDDKNYQAVLNKILTYISVDSFQCEFNLDEIQMDNILSVEIIKEQTPIDISSTSVNWKDLKNQIEESREQRSFHWSMSVSFSQGGNNFNNISNVNKNNNNNNR